MAFNILFSISKTRFFGVSLCIFLSISNQASATFLKAIDAIESQDGQAMVAEVHDAASKKNLDGANLFLSVLNLYPDSWRKLLTTSENEAMLSVIAQAIPKNNLSLQYKLAAVQSKFSEEKKVQVTGYESLIKLAEQGYSPASFHLYMYTANKDQETISKYGIGKPPIHWLISAANSGNPEASFYLGMKYLNIQDDFYGCNQVKSSNCSLQFDEMLGWKWMRNAAKNADSHNIRLGDYAYWMSELYLGRGAHIQPDYKQSYLWLKQINYGFGNGAATVWPSLKRLNDSGHLKEINPLLANELTKTPGVPGTASIEASRLWQKELTNVKERPVLMRQKSQINRSSDPSISIHMHRSNNLNTSHFISLDIYEKGTVNLLLSEDIALNEENKERWFSLKPEQVSTFATKLTSFGDSDEMPSGVCSAGCLENVSIVVKVLEGQNTKYINLGSGLYKSAIQDSKNSIERLIKLIETYTPIYQQMCSLQIGEDKSRCLTVLNRILKN